MVKYMIRIRKFIEEFSTGFKLRGYHEVFVNPTKKELDIVYNESDERFPSIRFIARNDTKELYVFNGEILHTIAMQEIFKMDVFKMVSEGSDMLPGTIRKLDDGYKFTSSDSLFEGDIGHSNHPIAYIEFLLGTDWSWIDKYIIFSPLWKRALVPDLEKQLEKFKIKFSENRKLHYRTDFHGLPISIENRKGSKRYWYDPLKDESGETKMNYAYGYIRSTEGADGDSIDCYLGDNKESTKVFVVHQNNPKTGKFDEDKVMLGFDTEKEAKKAYLTQYDDPKFFGSITEMNIDDFQDKVTHKQKGKIK
ncbi:hypothetical protein LCGC14_2043770 [marine sediment metagenome]|uniref:Inorganic pyrophosphatase domain-containing protein n=2 Tax=marine sediment metagenome TaxID=412755 RepID=A0A0F9ER71_9ZZZZ